MEVTLTAHWPLAFLPVIALVWWIRRRSAVRLSKRHLSLLTLVRTLVVLFLALALSRPVWQRSGSWISVVYVVDVSESISPSSIDSTLRWIATANERGSPAHARYVVFASGAEVVEEPDDVESLPVSPPGSGPATRAMPRGVLDRGSTNIEQALFCALRSFAPHTVRRVVLFTDGHETAGDLRRALWTAKREGVRVFTFPAAVRAEGDVFIEGVGLPDEVRAGEPIPVEVRLFSRRSVPAAVGLRRVDTPTADDLGRKSLRLEPGENRIRFEIRLDEPGSSAIQALVEAGDDPFPGNNQQIQPVVAGPRSVVLHVEGRPESARFLMAALRAEGLEVIGSSEAALPDTVEGLERYAAVVLSDVAADRLGEARMAALANYVRDLGGGLVFIAGEASFGASGYAGTALEEALPVRFRTREKRKDLALVVAFDKSYSMKGEKIELAKEATRATLDLLDDEHFFGLVTFDWYPRVVVPLQSLKSRSQIRESIGDVQASSPTRIFPALEEAYAQLAANDAKVKHVILLSDGKSYADDFETLVTRMAKDRITISTVAVGEDVDQELLSNIARWGNGRTYVAQDARRVPEIFIREAEIARDATLIEEPFRAVVKRRVEALRGIDFSAAPPLRGYATTLPKPSADVLLETGSQAPILVRWQYGLGKAVMFASDAKNRWAADWLGWQGYGKFWAQIVRETMRTPKKTLDFRVDRRQGEALVSIAALDDQGRFVNGAEPRVEVTDPEGNLSTHPLRQVAPGTYQARVPLSAQAESPHRFRLADPAPSLGPGTNERALFEDYPEEYRFYPPDDDLLRFVSGETGGKFAPQVEDIFAANGDTARRPVPLFPVFAALSLILYIFDIALRRVPALHDRLQSHSGSAALSAHEKGSRAA